MELSEHTELRLNKSSALSRSNIYQNDQKILVIIDSQIILWVFVFVFSSQSLHSNFLDTILNNKCLISSSARHKLKRGSS